MLCFTVRRSTNNNDRKHEDYVYVKGEYQSTLPKLIIIWDAEIRLVKIRNFILWDLKVYVNIYVYNIT